MTHHTHRLAAIIAASVACLSAGPGITQSLPENCAPHFEAQRVTVIVPSRAGGGFDTYARGFATTLSEVIGHTVSVANVVGGGGLLAMSQVADQRDDEILLYVDGAEQVVNTTDHTDILPFGSDAFAILAILFSEPEAWLGNPTLDFASPDLTRLVFSTSSLESNFVPMVLAARALGLELDVVAGYGGSAEAIGAVLRGETDLTTASLTSSLRGAESGDVEIGMIVTDTPAPRAPEVPIFLGENSIFEARAAEWDADLRAERLALAETVLALGQTRRALFTASSLSPDVLSCVRAATDLALLDPALEQTLAEQGRPLVPELSDEAQSTFVTIQTTYAEYADVIAQMLADFGG